MILFLWVTLVDSIILQFFCLNILFLNIKKQICFLISLKGFNKSILIVNLLILRLTLKLILNKKRVAI